MKALLIIISALSISVTVLANDGGIAAIKVDQIKMRETAFKNGEEVIVKKIVKPSFTITIEGGEAAKLQKILPSESSVVTGMHPEIATTYNESFKALGIYNDASSAASSKAITISCSDAKLSENGDKVIKTGKSVCTITIGEGNSDDQFGDMQTFDPKSCK